MSSLKLEHRQSIIQSSIANSIPDIMTVRCGGNNIGTTPPGEIMFLLRGLLHDLFVN